MLSSELIEMLTRGVCPVVTFKKRVEDWESYLEPGMRGRLVAVRPKHDMHEVTVDLAEFDEFNRPFETANYYDSKGNPCLTARAAGYYKPTEKFLLDLAESVDDILTLEPDDRLAVYQWYKQSASDQTYIQWLEDRVLAAHQT